eukprot:gene9700-10414_t
MTARRNQGGTPSMPLFDSLGYLGFGSQGNTSIPCIVPEHKSFRIAVLLQRDAVLVPGQIAPIRERESACVRAIEEVLAYPNKLFLGVACDPSLTGHFKFGTIIEIKRVQRGTDLLILTKGYERFIMLRDCNIPDGSRNRPLRSVIWAEAKIARDVSIRLDRLMLHHRTRPYSLYIEGTAYPPWLCQLMHVSYLKDTAFKLLQENLSWGSTPPNLPDLKYLAPTQFTYKLMAQLPLTLEQQVKLFEMPNVNTRLIHLIQALKLQLQEGRLRCKTCGAELAQKQNIINIMSDGTVGTYVNPNGFIHQIITLSSIDHFQIRSRPTLTDTWFK